MQRSFHHPRTAAATIAPAHAAHGAATRLLAVLWLLAIAATAAVAAEPLPVRSGHPLYHKALPPGGIWKSPAATAMQQGTFQPVAFSGPGASRFSLPQAGGLTEGDQRLMAGLMVGAIYRFRVSNIPNAPGAEVYPTVELIGRTYPPPGLETLFPIPINLSETDLEAALEGNLVTRVIYLEDPQTAPPIATEPTDPTPIDLTSDQDALATADALGRPIAIVRIGSMTPPTTAALEHQFYFGYPAWAPIYRPTEARPNP